MTCVGLDSHLSRLNIRGVLLSPQNQFIRHAKLKMTLAMQAGIATTFLNFDDAITRIDAANTVPAKRRPYKKRAT